MTTRDLSDVTAVVLAGGRGTRLHPFTVTFPKPLVPVGDRPILHRLMGQLADAGVRRVVLSLGHLSSLIRAYVSQHETLHSRLEIDFVEEDAPLGTAGSVALVDGLESTFLVVNGDLLTDIDFGALVEEHRRSGAAMTVSRFVRVQPVDFGVLDVEEDGTITGYREKPEQTLSVSMGVYVYEPRVLRFVERGRHLDFPDLVLKLIASGERVHSYLHRGMWLDIGRPDDYGAAQDLVSRMEDPPRE